MHCWQQFFTSVLMPPLRCGCVNDVDCLPPKTTVVFVGDSITRYQYLDLVYTLHFGNRSHEQRATCNPLQETTWPSWIDFFKGTHHELQPHEQVCDCYRDGGPTFDLATENRLYVHPACNIRVAYLQAFGNHFPLQGHWPLQTHRHKLWKWRYHPISGSEGWQVLSDSVRRFDWSSVMRHVVAWLLPTVVVLNSGLWESNLDFPRIRMAAKDTPAECVVWKTTTATGRVGWVAQGEEVARHVFASDVIFDAGSLTNVPDFKKYWDSDRCNCHFVPQTGAYHMLNAALIQQLHSKRCLNGTSRPVVRSVRTDQG